MLDYTEAINHVDDVLSNKAKGSIIISDNLPILERLPEASIDLIYIDPPWNTGRKQTLRQIQTLHRTDGSYREVIGSKSYEDRFESFLEFLDPRLRWCKRLLKSSGSLFFHIGVKESHYCKILLDEIFGRENFLNEIIWAYDYGGRSTKKWPEKHDTIFVYVKNTEKYYFDINASDRIPYMAPGLVGPEKTARGKTPTDTWWHTIVPTQGKERTGYPTQKPLGIVSRAVKVSCPEGGVVADFFAGSGTTGEAAYLNNRRFILVDSNDEAGQVMQSRLCLSDDVGYAKVS